MEVSIMKRLAGLAMMLLLVASSPLTPAIAAGKYKACSLLTAADLEAALQAKVTRTIEAQDIIIDKGSYKGEAMSGCTWVLGSMYASVGVIRAPRTPQEREEGLAKLRGALDTLKQKGWTIQSTRIAGVECGRAVPPASENTRPIVSCFAESKGVGFSVNVVGSGGVTVQQVAALAGKVVARLP
jgi:hypothetical protein